MSTMLTMRQPLRLSLALISLLLANSPVNGQDPHGQAVATMAVDVKVVTLPVTVRDKKGQIVRNLSKDDFVLQEDGRLQVIKYFTQDTNLPLTLGLLVDTSLSQRNVLDQERNASKVFLDQMLTDAKDKAFVIHFDREVELLQDLTSSRDKLQAGLELLRTSQLDRNGGASSDPQSSPGSGNGQSRMSRGSGTLLYDAIFLASDELMKKQQGRKAVIVLSDGDDRGSKESLQSAIEAAQRADTVVYSILFADNHQRDSDGFGRQGGGGMGRHGGSWPGGGWPGGGGSGSGGPGGGGRGGGRNPQEPRVDGKKILEQISKETGGRLYEVSKKQAIDQIYDSIAEELRTQYNLGYTPDKDNPEAGFHKINLLTKQKDLVVQTRDGYYADR
jgi:VWFA-related protein